MYKILILLLVFIGIVVWFGAVPYRTQAPLVEDAVPNEASARTPTTYIGGVATDGGVSMQPRELISDSRCPQGVECIWAGTVEVRTTISTSVAHGEHTLTLGVPQTFGDYTVTLVAATPQPVAGENIPLSAYRFTFEVKRR